MTRFCSLIKRTLGFQCRTGLTFAVCFSLFSLFACEQDQAPAQKTALLIEKLRPAKTIDVENLSDSHTDSTQAADSIYQAERAQIVIGQLKRGEEVPRSEIDDALNVPPKSIPADAKLELIKELKIAEGRDELGEETHGPGNDWLAWDSYRQQRDRAESIVKALESGEEVPWSEIQHALRVLEEP
jgi:hypothetical protein